METQGSNTDTIIKIQQTPMGYCSYNDEGSIHEGLPISHGSKKKFGIAIAICTVFMVGQIVAGIKANSLAIQTDALHLLSDILSFAISLFSLWASTWEASPRHTYGFSRMEILGALASVLITWVMTGFLFYEGIQRLLYKGAVHEVKGFLMVLVSSIELCLNIFLALLFGHHGHAHGHHGHAMNVNLQSAYIHAIGDCIFSFGILIGGIVIWCKPNWWIVDPSCTFIFSVLVLKTTFKMIKDIYQVLMQATPDGINSIAIKNSLCEDIEEVHSVHKLHIWSVTRGKVILSVHIKVNPDANPYAVLDQVVKHIDEEYRIQNVTVQLEV